VAAGASIVWFRNDLRLADNPALLAAVARRRPVIPVYIWAPQEEGAWPPGAASRWWLHQSLARLSLELQQTGSRLILRRGSSLRELRGLVRETGAEAVFWNRRYEPAARERDASAAAALQSDGIRVETHNASLLFEPGEVLTAAGQPYKVFTAFWKACLGRGEPRRPLPVPPRLIPPSRWPGAVQLSAFELEPAIDWAAGIRSVWRPGGEEGAAQLGEFLRNAFVSYPEDRNRPDRQGSSRLAPYLQFGEISPCQVWHAVAGRARELGSPAAREAARIFLGEIGWREFGYQLLFHFPVTPQDPLREEFRHFPWQRDPRSLRAWKRGRTGFPLVDAGMRELWATGWMHNRVRMVAASFLVKDLLLPWQEGARWFWDTLVDADLANNTLGWQWTAGCGADAAPFFRIFNPVAQAAKFDPEGTYVRAWVPELAKLPFPWLLQPWEAPAEVLAGAGVKLGRTYPRPLVDHALARERALEALKNVRNRETEPRP